MIFEPGKLLYNILLELPTQITPVAVFKLTDGATVAGDTIVFNKSQELSMAETFVPDFMLKLERFKVANLMLT